MGWGTALSIGSKIVGGILGSKATSDANSDNLAYQEKINAQNIQLQKDFAQQGIRWKVADAKAAGLHPLAALGAQTNSFSPIAVGAVAQPDYSISNAVSDMGQDISRAVAAHQSKAERARELERQQAINSANQKLSLERHQLDVTNMGLQNELLKAQIAKMRGQVGPGLPSYLSTGSRGGRTVSDPTSPTGAIEIVPSQVISANPNVSSVEAGVGPGFRTSRIGGDRTGVLYDFPNEQLSQGLESMGAPAALGVTMAHNMLRSGEEYFYGGSKKGLPELPKSHRWEWSVIRQRYVARPVKGTPHNPWKRY